ncbi:MAG: bifunctional 5,10-methylene-tetrahydrofolate dehydrogenase/5,10-methylene-tetrahydrofolate cyclohydrolase [Candidatus Moranbacteria bacterium CG_4_9_14_3_um_filter_40_7]|nr:MAG: bifunctional 5,10-methylene-tetrahydrofolate dehydrogenase/5,10-methylene-tetrahydrofolate cyclohydrolase [Candidatus Moranbacteria bacterium CG23_combo_of_CG06-09_8_20_14_all_40_16]PIU80546.1 MAG: bifunctional 5,10-methylene-tetrahydrofolate dehydrogenase/5,10-methylene-tetrahydrofolate cyclohydrolase [Candidatus Moranbacteria bacterium CG06_land_8_20_14_3_00_40_12]PJA87751.1 MAG: bifunctional 5,10-methylene-tetrahydrofolate dehydrogenase/5,10-methylene-tetrahydrofolate cyclohydrolase [C
MKLLKGKKIADKILTVLEKKIKKLFQKPCLAVILVGNDLASDLYIRLKKKAAKKIGIKFQLFRFSVKVKEVEIIQKIKKLNADKKISGIIVQLPLPGNLNTQRIINALDPRKDVDGFHPENIKLFLEKQARFFPVFPQAIMEILKSSRAKLKGKKSLVIANSKIFGETMVVALENKRIKASYFLFKELKNKRDLIKKTEIIVSAIGCPGFLRGEMLKKGALVVDGGITKKEKKILGDIDYSSAKKIVSFLTPVPGGVGPVTIACLLRNTYKAAEEASLKRLSRKCKA